MPGTSSYALIDRLIGGTLEQRLRDQREAGLSFADIRLDLYAEHDVNVSTDTLRRWCNELGIEKAGAA